jgi:hypothetical protein
MTSNDTVVEVGTNVTLTCKGKGFPEPKIRWRTEYWDEMSINGENGKRVKLLENFDFAWKAFYFDCCHLRAVFHILYIITHESESRLWRNIIDNECQQTSYGSLFLLGIEHRSTFRLQKNSDQSAM